MTSGGKGLLGELALGLPAAVNNSGLLSRTIERDLGSSAALIRLGRSDLRSAELSDGSMATLHKNVHTLL